MLNNSNENNDNKLFGSDTPASGNRLYGANEPNNEVKLFGADAPQEQKKLFGVEDDLNEDEFVKSSFAVSFKANEAANTVSEKLNEEAEKALDAELNSIAPPVVPVPENNTPSYNDGWEDEFDNFEFDSSVSAFKPLAPEAAPVFPSDDKSDFNAPAAVPVEDKIEEPAPEPEAAAEPEPQIEEPVIETTEAQTEETAAPVFDDSDSDLYGFAGDADDQKELFNSGDDLDFATSETDKDVSPFANAEKPAEPEAADIDIPSNSIDAEIESYGKVSSGVNAFKPVEQPQEAEIPAAEETTPAGEDNNSEIGSYGKVSSGVNAFKSPAADTAEAPVESTPEAVSEEYIDPENVTKTRPGDDIEEKPAEISDDELRARYAPTSNTGKMYMNNRQTGSSASGKGDVSRLHKKPTPPVKKTPVPAHAASAAPAAAAAPAVNPAFKPAADIKAKEAEPPINNDILADTANDTTVSAFVPRGRTNAVSDTDSNRSVRPGSSNNTQPVSRPIPVTNASKNVAPKSARSGRNEISPVTTSAVSKKKSRRSRSSKESGKSGIITLIVIIVLFIGAIFVMDHLNDIKNFFSGGTDSVATLETTTTATSASEDSTTTTTTSEATTTTTTTEATTTTTTTEATTTTTTSEATTTTTTTEATTTTTTTEATTTTTTKKDSSSGGVKVTNFETKLKNFKRTAGGFSFEITMENKSNNDASLTKSLNAIELRVYADQDIKKVTADGFKFKENDGKWIGTPSDMTIKAGAKVKFTVTVSTSGNVGHFGYRSCFFDWK